MKLDNIVKEERFSGKKHTYTKESILKEFQVTHDDTFEMRIYILLCELFEKINNERSNKKKLAEIFEFAKCDYLREKSYQLSDLNDRNKGFVVTLDNWTDDVSVACDNYLERHLTEITGRSPEEFEEDELYEYFAEYYPTTEVILNYVPENLATQEFDKIIGKLRVYFQSIEKTNKEPESVKSGDGEDLNESVEYASPVEFADYVRKLQRRVTRFDVGKQWAALDRPLYIDKIWKILKDLYIPPKFININTHAVESINAIYGEVLKYEGQVIDKAKERLAYIARHNGEYFAPNGIEYRFGSENDCEWYLRRKASQSEIFKLAGEEVDGQAILTARYNELKSMIKNIDLEVNDMDGEELNESKLMINEDVRRTEKDGYKLGDKVINISSNELIPETITEIIDAYSDSGNIFYGTMFTLEWEDGEGTMYSWKVDEKTLKERYIPYEIFVSKELKTNDGEDLDEE